MSFKQVGIGLVGLGTVGSGLIQIIEKKKNYFKRKYKLKLSINGISAKNKSRKRPFNQKKYVWYSNPLKMIENQDIDIIVELVGGSDGLALNLAKQSLKEGKFFVTANKALIAKHGSKMFELSNKYNAKLSFEAAVGGGIPIIRLMQNSMIVGKTRDIYGILNGTCNYILTQMEKTGDDFKNVLKKIFS